MQFLSDNIESGQYYRIPLEWLNNSWRSDAGVERPTFQRVPSKSRVEELKNALDARRDPSGKILQTGILSIAVMNNKRYIIDGQHRLEAYRQLKEPSLVLIQIWEVQDEKEMRDIFIQINSHVPIEKYLFDPDTEKRLCYTTLIDYVEKEYRPYLKSRSKTGTTQFPNINTEIFRELIPYIDTLKDCTSDNVIEAFEAYNKTCRSTLMKDKHYREKTIEKEKLSKVNNNKMLYINRDIMALWNMYASEIGK